MNKERFLEVTEVDKYLQYLGERAGTSPQQTWSQKYIPTLSRIGQADVGAGAKSVGKGLQHLGSMPVGRKLAVGGALAVAAPIAAGVGVYKGIKGIAKGAVNAVRYPFRPYEPQPGEEE